MIYAHATVHFAHQEGSIKLIKQLIAFYIVGTVR